MKCEWIIIYVENFKYNDKTHVFINKYLKRSKHMNHRKGWSLYINKKEKKSNYRKILMFIVDCFTFNNEIGVFKFIKF